MSKENKLVTVPLKQIASLHTCYVWIIYQPKPIKKEVFPLLSVLTSFDLCYPLKLSMCPYKILLLLKEMRALIDY